MTEPADFSAFILQLADLAGAQVLPFFRQGAAVENKLADGQFDPVTVADRAAERAIRDQIRQMHPTHAIRGEEFGYRPGTSAYTWVIDPIDGTRAFISGLPVWGVLIGLLKDDLPVLGLMDQPFTGERFVGSGSGACLHRNNTRTPMHVRKCPDLAGATLCTTDPYLFLPAEQPAFETIRARSQVQRYGLDCYAYAALAMGGVDLVIESGLQAYDICGLIPVIEAAGGQITTWSGKSAAGGGQIVASGDPCLHEQVLAILGDAATD